MRGSILAATALVLGLAGCLKPAEPPVVLEAAQVEPMLRQASDLSGRRVSIDGYLGLDNGIAGQGIAIGQVLTTRPDARGDELLRLEAPEGTRAGQLNLPVVSEQGMPGFPGAPKTRTIDMSRAEWRDAAGGVHPLTDRVRVTGRVVYVGIDEDPTSPGGKRFNPRLADIVLDAPPAS
jgi:hypothetical protein